MRRPQLLPASLTAVALVLVGARSAHASETAPGCVERDEPVARVGKVRPFRLFCHRAGGVHLVSDPAHGALHEASIAGAMSAAAAGTISPVRRPAGPRAVSP